MIFFEIEETFVSAFQKIILFCKQVHMEDRERAFFIINKRYYKLTQRVYVLKHSPPHKLL